VAKRRRRTVSDSIAGASASSSETPWATWETNVSTKEGLVKDELEETGVSFDDGEDVEKCLSTSVFLYYSAESLRLLLGLWPRTARRAPASASVLEPQMVDNTSMRYSPSRWPKIESWGGVKGPGKSVNHTANENTVAKANPRSLYTLAMK